MRLISTAAIAAALTAVPAAAQDDDPRAAFDALVAANARTLDVSAERATGAGYDWLVEEGAAAQFVLIGEIHATADVPHLAAALFEGLAGRGYDTIAVEAGPIATRRLEGLARDGGLAAVEAFVTAPGAGRPMAFVDWREEADFFTRAVAASGRDAGAAWGLDQEFAFAAPFLLDELARLADTDARRAAVETARAAAADAAPAPWLAVSDPADVAALAEAFAGAGEAAEIVDEMARSNRIYQLWLDPDTRGESNKLREFDMVRRFLERIEAGGEIPRVMFKFGGYHAAPSVDEMGRISLATFVESWAGARGLDAFNVMVDCAGGTNLTTGGADGHAEQPCAGLLAGGGQNATSAAAPHPFAAVMPDAGAVVIDLRPLRPRVRDWEFLSPDARKLIVSFDAYVAIVDVSPATPFAAAP